MWCEWRKRGSKFAEMLSVFYVWVSFVIKPDKIAYRKVVKESKSSPL